MKRLAIALTAFCGCALTSPCWSHYDAEELGHHWEVPSYSAEIWLQLSIMALMTLVYIVSTRLVKALRK